MLKNFYKTKNTKSVLNSTNFVDIMVYDMVDDMCDLVL